MKAWIRRVLGQPEQPQINTELNALDNYVIVSKDELEKILDELRDLRSQKVDTDARELDMMVADLEQENRLIRARNERLQGEINLLTNALRDATGTHQDVHKP